MAKRKKFTGYNRPVPENLKVVSYDKNGSRYAIIDADTGEVFDDAQGWGYKTAQNAYRALAYKRRSKAEFQQDEKIKMAVRAFWNSHKSLNRDIDAEIFDSMKNGEKLSQKDLESMIPDSVKSTLTFDVKYLFKYR